jgi:CRP/FNR family transcriptional regulator
MSDWTRDFAILDALDDASRAQLLAHSQPVRPRPAPCCFAKAAPVRPICSCRMDRSGYRK